MIDLRMRFTTKTTHMAKEKKPVLMQGENKPSKLRDQRLLKLFTILAEGNDATRIKKTEELLQYLLKKQASCNEGICDDVQYSVNRLVQGLASSRKFARLGYSTALCQVLKSVDGIEGQLVMDCIHEKVKATTAGQPSKSEVGNAYLGQTFGYLTLIHSQKLFMESKEQITHVVKQLLKLGTRRSYLQQLCMNGLVQIIAQVKHKVFQQLVLPHIETEFTNGWGECSPDTLLLIMYSSKYHSKVVKDFLKEHWLDEQLISEKNFPLIADVVMRSTQCHPVVHCVNDALVSTVMEQNLDVVQYWKSVVHPLFEAKSTFGSKNRVLGLHIFDKLLPALNTPEKIEGIVSPHITDILIHYKPKKTDDVARRALPILNQLTEMVKTSKDPHIQIAVIKSLVKKPGSFLFDAETRTNTLHTITSNLVPEAATVLMKALMKTFNQQPSWIGNKDTNHTVCAQWCIKQIGLMVSSNNHSLSWQLNALQFLFVNSFFNIKKSSNDIPHCGSVNTDMSGQLRKCVSDNLFKTIGKLISHNTSGESRARQFGEHLDVLFGLVEYGNTLLKNTDHVQLQNTEFPEEAFDEWQKLVNVLETINKKRKLVDKIGDSHAFELLFIHAGLQLFLDPDGAIETLQDLHMCYKKSTQRRKSMAKDDGPDWIDVITELLLSLMFKDAALSRTVAKHVMSTLADHVTEDSLQLILDTLKQASLDGEEGIIGLEDDEDDDDGAGEKNEDTSDVDDNDKTMIDNDDYDISSSSSDEEDEEKDEKESDIEEEAGIDVADNFKHAVKAALGNAAGESDQESEEDVDMSDSEMFKLDGVLSAAFKSMKKGKKKMDKEKERQLVTFKIRVLDLLEAIIKHHPSVALLKRMVVPLLDVIRRGKRKKEEETLGNKALDVYHDLCKVKKVIPDASVDSAELLDLLRTLMKYSAKVSVPSLVLEVGKSCLLIIRMLLNIQDATGPSPLKTRSSTITKMKTKVKKDQTFYQEHVVAVVQEELMEMFHHKPGHSPAALFHIIIDRYPLMFWSLWTHLLQALSAEDIKVYQKTQATAIVANIINKQLVTVLGTEGWGEFLGEWRTTATKVINEMDSTDVKVKFVEELLTVFTKILHVAPDNLSQVLDQGLMTKLESMKSSFNQEIRLLYNKLDRNVNPQDKNIKKKEKSKKRKQNADEASAADKKVKLDNVESNGKTNDLLDSSTGNDTGIAELNVTNGVIADGETPGKKKKHKRKSKHGRESLDNSVKQNEEETTEHSETGEKVNEVKLTEKDGADVPSDDGTPKSQKKKKKHKRKSTERENDTLVNGDELDTSSVHDFSSPSGSKKNKIESNTSKEPTSPKINTSINGKADTPKNKKEKKRNSNEAEMDLKHNKFSPRYTRSMRK